MLNDTTCQDYLSLSLNRPVKYRPKILCVTKSFQWNVDVWTASNTGRYTHIVSKKMHDSYMKHFHYGAKYSEHGFFTSPGTCSGDSGGPIYVRTGAKTFVITGGSL